MKKNVLPVVLGLLVFVAMITPLILYFVFLPDSQEQQEFSPFAETGTWECEEVDFVITSTEYQNEIGIGHTVNGTLNYLEQTYQLGISTRSTRGANLKYAFFVTIYTENNVPRKEVYAYGEFEQGRFELFDFFNDTLFLEQFSKLTFTKIN